MSWLRLFFLCVFRVARRILQLYSVMFFFIIFSSTLPGTIDRLCNAIINLTTPQYGYLGPAEVGQCLSIVLGVIWGVLETFGKSKRSQ